MTPNRRVTFDCDIVALDVAALLQPRMICRQERLIWTGGRAAEQADDRHCGLLRTRRERPRGCRAAKIADRIPQDGEHQRWLATNTVGEPAGADCSDETQPKREGEYRCYRGYRNAELLGDRRHDEQEDCEIECVKRPPEPCGNPSQPLIVGRFFPPSNRQIRSPGSYRHCIFSP